MGEQILAFGIWGILGCLFLLLGARAFFARKPMGFWANAEVCEVTDVRNYNRAVGKLFLAFGIVFLLLGLPLLAGQNSPWILLSVAGVMFESIGAMIVYTLVIEKKYKKK